MLQSIRDRSRGWLVHAIVVAMVLVFTFWGLHGLLGQQSPGHEDPIIVRVAGLGLSQHDFESAYQRLYRQAQRHLGTDTSLDEQVRRQLKEQTLKQWVFLQVLARSARQDHYRVNQTEVDSVLLGIPEFQMNGRFSSPRFYALLDALGYTEARFFGDLRKSLLIRQVQQGLTKTAFFLPSELDQFVAHLKQTRSIAYAILPSRRFSAEHLPPVSDAQALTYYKAHKQQFTSAERVRVSYIRLSSKSRNNAQVFAAARDQLADLAYIHPNSLDIAAKNLGLPIQSSTWFDRTGGNDLFTKNPKITGAAFSEEVLRGHNSSVIDLDANTALVLRVQEHQVPFIQPFASVKGQIIRVLRKQFAAEKTQAMGEALLSQLRAQKGQDTFDKEIDPSSELQWHYMDSLGRYMEGISPTLLNTVFSLPPVRKGKPIVFGGTALANGDYLLVKLLSVQPGKTAQLSASNQKMYHAALKESFGQLDYALYADDVLKKARQT